MGGAAVFALLTVASSFAIGRVIDDVILPRFEDGEVATSTVLPALGLVIGIGVLRAIAIVVRRSYASITHVACRADLHQPGGATDTCNSRSAGTTGVPMATSSQRAGVDAEATVSVLAPIPFASGTIVMLVASTVWMLLIDVPLGLVAVVVFPLLLATNVVYEKSVSAHFTRAQDQLGEFSAGVHESFEGVQLVKSYGAEERETERLAGLADQRPRVTRAGDPLAELVRGAPRRDPVAHQHHARRDRRAAGAVGRRHHRRVLQRDLPVHPARVPAAAHRLHAVGASTFDGGVAPHPARCSTSRSSPIRPTASAVAAEGSASSSTVSRSLTRATGRRP